jgi:hypothetical protein
MLLDGTVQRLSADVVRPFYHARSQVGPPLGFTL